jgi:hypothetical protein
MKDCPVAYREVALSPEEVLKDIGYNDMSSPDADLVNQIHHLLTLLEGGVHPRYTCFVSEGQFDGMSVRIRDQQLNTGPTITRLLDRSTLFAVFAATAGREFEQIQQTHKSTGDMLVTYLLDLMGTLLVEKVGDYMERQLEAGCPGLQHTHRFSPGYCNWHLTEQRKIFHLLAGQPSGIVLSEVCLMTPIKSISGIIGIGREVQIRQYACQYCELENCYKRKKADYYLA